jgi:hypothetical protein
MPLVSDTFLQPRFGSRSRISGAYRSSNSSNVNLPSTVNSPNSGSVMINFDNLFPWPILASVTHAPLTRRATFLDASIIQQATALCCSIRCQLTENRVITIHHMSFNRLADSFGVANC